MNGQVVTNVQKKSPNFRWKTTEIDSYEKLMID